MFPSQWGGFYGVLEFKTGEEEPPAARRGDAGLQLIINVQGLKVGVFNSWIVGRAAVCWINITAPLCRMWCYIIKLFLAIFHNIANQH